ncbi:MAG: hypothetical protein ACYTEQ_00040 [Planctomycetota bacterium]
MSERKCLWILGGILIVSNPMTVRAHLGEQPGAVSMESILDEAPLRECHASTIVQSKGSSD